MTEIGSEKNDSQIVNLRLVLHNRTNLNMVSVYIMQFFGFSMQSPLWVVLRVIF